MIYKLHPLLTFLSCFWALRSPKLAPANTDTSLAVNHVRSHCKGPFLLPTVTNSIMSDPFFWCLVERENENFPILCHITTQRYQHRFRLLAWDCVTWTSTHYCRTSLWVRVACVVSDCNQLIHLPSSLAAMSPSLSAKSNHSLSPPIWLTGTEFHTKLCANYLKIYSAL